MKNIYKAILACLCCVLVASCGFDDPVTEYPTKSVLFTYQFYNRELVVGEGLRFKLGVVFAGLEENDHARNVTYTIDESLVPDGYQLMPSDYYTCSDPNTIVIPKGELKGYMPVEIDSAKFLSDPISMTGKYVIPFRIVSADADTITSGKEYMVLSLKYLAKQFGYYQYSGTATNMSTGETIKYSYVSTETTSVRELTTAGPTTLRVNADPYGTGDPAKNFGFTMLITLPTKGGGDVVVSADSTSAIVVEQNGSCTYDEASKTFNLNYKYSVDGVEYSASDKMVFRNRIRDDQGNGVKINEWEGF